MKNIYRIYIDEVGTATMSNLDNFDNRYLSLTGIIVNINYMNNVIAPVMEEWKRKYFPNNKNNNPVIFHRKELINKRFPFDTLSDKKTEEEFNKDFLRCLSDWNYEVVTILIDKKEHSNKYSVWQYEPYHFCFRVLLERYYYFLCRNKSKGDVMIEARGGNEDMKLKKSFERILKGSDDDKTIAYVKSNQFRELFTSVELKLKRKSFNDLGLQLADLIAYPSRQNIFKIFNIDIKQKKTFNDKIIEILDTKYSRTAKGEIIGAGIKFLK